MSETVTMITRGREPREALAPLIAGDESGLRRLAELLVPYLPEPESSTDEDRWMSSREAAAYAGTTLSALHHAMAARAVHFEQDTPRGRRGSSARTSTTAAALRALHARDRRHRLRGQSSATFGAFTLGVEKDYAASTSATVISTAGDAVLRASEAGHLANGAFRLAERLRVELSNASWTAPVSNHP